MRWLCIGLFVGSIAWTLLASFLQLRELSSPEALQLAAAGAVVAAVSGLLAIVLSARSRWWLRPVLGLLGLALAAGGGLMLGGRTLLENPAVLALVHPPPATEPATRLRRPTPAKQDDAKGLELELDRQTRRVVAGAGTSYHATPPLGAVKMLIGLGGRGPNPPSGRVSVERPGQPANVLWDGTLEYPDRWLDIEIPLVVESGGDAASGSHAVPFDLRVEGHGAEASGIVVSEPAFVRSSEGLRPRNLVLISLDTTRADKLGTYGFTDLPTTPALDALAKRGTVFENCFSPAPWTTPSHMGLLTGIQPDELGMAQLSRSPRVDRARTMLAELFQSAAYLTVAFTGGATLAATHGFSDGFYFQQESYNQQSVWQRDLDTNAYLALRWLKAHRVQPFFLFFHTFEPHDPYVHQRFLSSDVLPGDQGLIKYLSGIAYTDDRLGTFLDRLQALGVLDDSIVVVTSDHGEGFRPWPRAYHGKTLYDEVLHVPLIMVGPGIPAGRRVAAQVPLTDLYATLAELFGLEKPDEVDSRSLMPLVRNETDEPRPVRLCCISPQLEAGSDGEKHLKPQLLGLRRDGFKYIVQEDGTHEELYDLAADPDETHNLADVYGATTRAMRRDVISQNARATKEATDSLKGTRRELDADYAAKLRSLGYLH
jgi:arylsulfatase A-like enzyme